MLANKFGLSFLFSFVLGFSNNASSTPDCSLAEQSLLADTNYCESSNDYYAVNNCLPGSPTGSWKRTVSVQINLGNGTFQVGCQTFNCNDQNIGFTSYGVYRHQYACFEEVDKEELLNLIVTTKATNNSCSQSSSGSIIYNSNRVIGETIPLVGLPFYLSHFSDRTLGRLEDYETSFFVDTTKLVSKVTSVEFKVYNSANQVEFSKSYNRGATPEDFFFSWNGYENNQLSWGSKPYTFVYKTYTPDQSIPDKSYNLAIGNFKAIKLGLGGWTPSIWHFYDQHKKKLYLGDGSFRNVEAVIDNGLFRVASSGGQEVYYFDQLGRLQLTKTGLTGSILYSFSYDANSENLVEIKDQFNKSTRFIYVDQKLSKIISPEGIETKVKLNQDGFLSEITNPKLETYKVEYVDSKGLISKFIKPNLNVSTFSYDEKGNLKKDVNSAGYLSELFKRDSGIKTISAMGRIKENNYNSDENLETFIKPSGLQITFINSNAVSETKYPDYVEKTSYQDDPRFGSQVKKLKTFESTDFGSMTTTEENEAVLTDANNLFSINNLTTTSVNGDSVVNYVYDGLTKTSTATTSLGRSVATQLDNLERPILEQTGELAPVRYFYSQELLSKIKHEEREINLKYDPQTKLLIESKNSVGQSTKYSYDEAQRLKSQTLPDGRVVNYTYDFQGNLVSLTPPSRPAHIQVYGQNDRLQSYNPPALAGVSNVNTNYTYNLDRDLTKITRPDGQEIHFNYGQTSGLLDSMTGSFETISRVYENEQVKKIFDQTGRSIELSYIGSRVSAITEKNAQNQVVSIYSRTPKENSNGLVASETVSAGNKSITVDFDYDADKFLTKAEDLELVYNSPNGSLKETKLKNIKEEYFYNKFGEVKGFRAFYLEGAEQKLLYSYELKRDKIGRIVKKIETFGKRELKAKHNKGRFFRFHENYCHAHKNDHKLESEYVYDKAGRLVKVENKHERDSVYIYDQNSNRIAGFNDEGRIDAVYDNQDRLIRYNDSVFSYNANGDLLSESKRVKKYYQTTNFNYDVFGQLKLAGNVSFDTNLLQLRSAKKLNGQIIATYIYDAQKRLIGEVDSQGNLKKRFIFASKPHTPDYFIDEELNSYKIITDHLGSVRLVVNANSGEVVQKMLHDEFGVVTENTNPGFIPFGFAGGIYDPETGLVRFGARDYNPRLGRWTSKDPIRFQGGDTNMYGYVLQLPTKYIDPEGTLSPASVVTCLGGFAIGGIYDIYSSINDQLEMQNQAEKKLNDLEKEKKSCTNESDKLKIEKKKQEILNGFQGKTLGNLAGIFTPGFGSQTAAVACIVAISTF